MEPETRPISMADIINQQSDSLIATAQSTAAQTENINLVSSAQVDFAFAGYDTAYYASKGEREYEGRPPLDGITMVMFGHVAVNTPVVFADSGINTFADLAPYKNKIFASPGGLGIVLASEMVHPWGISLPSRPTVLSYPEIADSMKNGACVIYPYHGANPASAILDLATYKPIRILAQTKESLSKIFERNPFWYEYTLPANTYSDQKEDVLTFAVPYCIITNEKTPDAVVREFLDKILNNDLLRVHPDGAYYTPDNECYALYGSDTAIPYHPAAEQYLKEHNIIQ